MLRFSLLSHHDTLKLTHKINFVREEMTWESVSCSHLSVICAVLCAFSLAVTKWSTRFEMGMTFLLIQKWDPTSTSNLVQHALHMGLHVLLLAHCWIHRVDGKSALTFVCDNQQNLTTN